MFSWLFFLVACGETEKVAVDKDQDGVVEGEDCNDSNPSILGPTDWFLDSDADLFGSSAATIKACAQPSGYVDNELDCNDENS